MKKTLHIRPYARLITMLGDQLIKNELIALAELVKNAYDADSDWVVINFVDFNDDFSIKPTSKIIIEDVGNGMNEGILEKHWLNPATPDKLKRKAKYSRTQKGRILQGEKGIGRFAIFKLGRVIKITTRRQLQDASGNFIDEAEQVEYNLSYDFSKYDDNFLSEGGEEKELYLEELSIEFTSNKPEKIVKRIMPFGVAGIERKPYGTIIEISNLKASWTHSKVQRVQREIGKLQPIFSKEESEDFLIYVWKDSDPYQARDVYREKLIHCMESKSVFKVTEGKYKAKGNEISFKINGEICKLNFYDTDISGLTQFKKYFDEHTHNTECGDFTFEFYLFDFNVNSENPSKYYLDRVEKQMIREHRVYLYRDNIRVMPYGDPEDDWLGVDIARGTISAAEFLSNDQVVGCVYISQESNPKLIDKTNREGLIEEGRALSDFITILQLILRYLRKKPYAQYLIEKKNKNEINRIKRGRPSELIELAKKQYPNDERIVAFLKKFESSYKKEKEVLQDRISKTENLAAVGLSVETAAHDVMIFINKAITQQDAVIKELTYGQSIDTKVLLSNLTVVRGNISMVETLMKDIQLLFPSTKSRTKSIDVREIIEKVYGLFKRPFAENKISVSINSTKCPLVVRTTDAVLLQVFINLFDNALYWLKSVEQERRIEILINGNEQRLIFSDSGPGIKADDEDYIFEAFYSGKGEEGRGLGLYIARQLLDRYDYSIELAEFSKDKILKGANFVLEFTTEGAENGYR